jgi:glucose-6-phosphate 1-dehydrogenase
MYHHSSTLPLPERTPVPVFDLVIAGASGDLAIRKLFPALVQRVSEGVIPGASRIVGIVRSGEAEESLKASTAARLKEQGLKTSDINGFLDRLTYVRADVSDPSTMAHLSTRLDDLGRVRAFYLATPPDLFIPASRSLKSAGLLEHDSRLILEKPLGRNLTSAKAINDAVAEVLPESRTYRIDHYLGKETVQNLLVLRFANSLFERSWSQRDIDHVQITVAETVGLEQRAAYYDQVGALRDMVQNHVLQLLCLFAMEPPNTLDADAVRDEKVRVLRALRPIQGRDVLRHTVRGQYTAGSIVGQPVPGYADELGGESGTETFTALRCEIDTWRWGGVPIYLRTGKRMGARCSEIAITFKSVPHSIFKGDPEPNRLVIRVQPDDGVQLQFMMKVPGSGRLKLVPRMLDLRYDTAFGERTPDAYERLLTDVIRGDQTLFMRRDEVEAAWGFVDPIIESWNEHYASPHRYAAGTFGPSQAVGMIERDGRSWAEPEVQG